VEKADRVRHVAIPVTIVAGEFRQGEGTLRDSGRGFELTHHGDRDGCDVTACLMASHLLRAAHSPGCSPPPRHLRRSLKSSSGVTICFWVRVLSRCAQFSVKDQGLLAATLLNRVMHGIAIADNIPPQGTQSQP
jgi:hypothetical protein